MEFTAVFEKFQRAISLSLKNCQAQTRKAIPLKKHVRTFLSLSSWSCKPIALWRRNLFKAGAF
jgi:hypothetical protein